MDFRPAPNGVRQLKAVNCIFYIKCYTVILYYSFQYLKKKKTYYDFYQNIVTAISSIFAVTLLQAKITKSILFAFPTILHVSISRTKISKNKLIYFLK